MNWDIFFQTLIAGGTIALGSAFVAASIAGIIWLGFKMEELSFPKWLIFVLIVLLTLLALATVLGLAV